jgi:putative membrane protein
VSEAPLAGPEDWRRTSRTGLVVRAVMAARNAALPTLAALVGSGAWRQGWSVIAPVFAIACAISFAMAWLAWRHFRYRLGDTDIRVERGLLSRMARSVPYERIQDVSVEQALIPRLFGMVEVKFETGAGGHDELKIGYISEAEGAALRETVRARKSGEGEIAGAGEAAEPEARLLFAMDLRRLLTFGLFEFSLVVFAVLAGVLQQFDFLLSFDFWDFDAWLALLAGPGHRLSELGLVAQALGAVLALSVLALVGLATGLGRTVLRDYGFRLEETPKGLRRQRGLLTRTDVVMPLHRVQALQITSGIVRRRFGWHALSVVSLAQDAKSESHYVVPFGTMAEIAPVVETTGFALPDEATIWHPASRNQRNDSIVLAMLPFALMALASLGVALIARGAGLPAGGPLLAALGLAALGGFLAVRAWYLWRHRRHAIDDRQLYVREGWLAPHLEIASRVKLQSVEIAQGPLARRRGYADVRFGVAGGKLEIRGVPIEAAKAIRAAVLDSIAAIDFSRLPG